MPNYKVFFLLLILLFLAAATQAQSLYVSDKFQITLRTGPSQEHKIIAMLPTGTKLEVLQELPEWIQVSTPDGKQGWVLKQFTMQRLPREQEISQLQTRLQKLQQQAGSSQEQNARLEQEKQELQAELQSLQDRLQSLEQSHQDLQEDAGNIQEIKQELERAKTALKLNRKQVSELRQENQEIRFNNNLYWFLAGAGTFFIAALLGFFLGRMQRKKGKKVYF
jgi:SH3 domain protein